MIGKTFGDYRITRELAEGGMGMVYEGICLSEQIPVAIKTLRKEITERREEVGRFIREATIYKRLVHPNLMRFYAFGFDANVGFYLVTELMVGCDLEERLAEQRGHPMPTLEALDIALQVCAGLSAAHQEGIVHRDLKPGNIFLAQQNGTEVAKVFDFGIAKMLESDSHQKLKFTMDGSALGTPLYMAPEQIRATDSQMGPPADIYALGVIIFQMLTGTPPFTGANPMTILTCHLRTPAPLLRKYQRAFSGSVIESLVHDMMAKEPSDRPASLDIVKERLWQARQHVAPDPAQGTLMEMPNFDLLQALLNPTASTTSPTQSPVAVLILEQSGREEEVAWLLRGETLQLGSDPHMGLRLRQPGVLERHAEVFCAKEGWLTIRALEGSTLRVNGATTTSTVLRDGDWITLGEAELKLKCL